MKNVTLKGKVIISVWLGKPTYFTQGSEFKAENAVQFYNREAGIEYEYDITFELNREISKNEYFEMQNALRSVIMMYGDRASESLFLWERMIHSYTGLFNFMEFGDIYISYFSKRHVLGKSDDIAFVSETEMLVDNRENMVTL